MNTPFCPVIPDFKHIQDLSGISISGRIQGVQAVVNKVRQKRCYAVVFIVCKKGGKETDNPAAFPRLFLLVFPKGDVCFKRWMDWISCVFIYFVAICLLIFVSRLCHIVILFRCITSRGVGRKKDGPMVRPGRSCNR